MEVACTNIYSFVTVTVEIERDHPVDVALRTDELKSETGMFTGSDMLMRRTQRQFWAFYWSRLRFLVRDCFSSFITGVKESVGTEETKQFADRHEHAAAPKRRRSDVVETEPSAWEVTINR